MGSRPEHSGTWEVVHRFANQGSFQFHVITHHSEFNFLKVLKLVKFEFII